MRFFSPLFFHPLIRHHSYHMMTWRKDQWKSSRLALLGRPGEDTLRGGNGTTPEEPELIISKECRHTNAQRILIGNSP